MRTEEVLRQGRDLVSKGRIADAEGRFREALKADAGSAEARIWLARTAILRGKREEAETFLKTVLSKAPDNAEAQALKAFCLMAVKDYQSAITLLEKARASDASLEMTYQNLSKSYRKVANWQRAEAIAREGIQRFPKNPQLHSELGYVLAKTKRLTEGIEEMLQSISADPLFLKGYLVLGGLYEAADKPDLVIGLYRKGLSHNPKAWILREELCRLYIGRKDLFRAYREAAELAVRRNEPIDYLRLGNLAMTIGKSKKAESAFTKCAELDKECWQAYLNLGGIYYAGKQFQKAKAVFARALETAPTHPEPAYNMALVCKALKDDGGAKQYAAIAIKLSQKGQAVYENASRLLERS